MFQAHSSRSAGGGLSCWRTAKMPEPAAVTEVATQQERPLARGAAWCWCWSGKSSQFIPRSRRTDEAARQKAKIKQRRQFTRGRPTERPLAASAHCHHRTFFLPLLSFQQDEGIDGEAVYTLGMLPICGGLLPPAEPLGFVPSSSPAGTCRYHNLIDDTAPSGKGFLIAH